VRSRKKWSVLGTLLVGVLSLLLIALPGTASARHHHKAHSHHKKHHKRHHRNRSGTRTGGGSTSTSGEDENAGTIASFDGTTLTITLTDGSSLSGMVTDQTEIKCEAAGDDNDQGDDNGDQGDDNDQGDGDNSGSGGGGDDAQTAAAMTHSDDGGSGDDNSGDDNGGDDNSGDGNGEQCTTADLTPGTQVSEADLSDENGQATFEEIELVK
jgi:hypothetical protein